MSLEAETIDPMMFGAGLTAEQWQALKPFYVACHAAERESAMSVARLADQGAVPLETAVRIHATVLMQNAALLLVNLATQTGGVMSAGEFLSRSIHALTSVTQTLQSPSRKDLH